MKKIFIITFILLILDLVSKFIITKVFMVNESLVLIKNFFALTYVGAFSILNGKVSFISIVSLIVVILLIYYLIKEKKHNNYEVLSYSLVLAGALGNLLNRLIYGYVIDFLDFNILGYNYPIFNLADIFIVIGIFLLIIYLIKEEKSR